MHYGRDTTKLFAVLSSFCVDEKHGGTGRWKDRNGMLFYFWFICHSTRIVEYVEEGIFFCIQGFNVCCTLV